MITNHDSDKSRAYLAEILNGDISDLIWPTYRRITAAAGGDVSASFTFTRDTDTMEDWFYTYLAKEFTESYGQEPLFMGRIHTMRLAYGRLVFTLSLDWLVNKVACTYTSVLDGSTLMTSFYSDSASQSTYGIRQHIIKPEENIGLSEAEDFAQQYLEDFKDPRISRGRFGQKNKPSLQVKVQGYSQTLDAQLYNYTTPGMDDASDEVSATLAGASFITEGEISANTAQVDLVSDYRPSLQRIAGIAAVRDSAGRRYNFGAVGGTEFDYEPVSIPSDTVPFRYHIYVKRGRLEYYDAVTGSYVAPPLVKPGGWSRVADMRILDEDDPKKDYLNQYDAVAVYDKLGTALQGSAWSARERSEAIQMTLINNREDS